MKVYALVGKSGTGKSYQALNLCRDLNIQAVIDDGLFIMDNEIRAGTSAKRQATKIGAMRMALFTNEEHRTAVSEKIKEFSPETILVLGTSEGMVIKIAQQLDLPEIEEMIFIEEITTEAQRSIADRQRNQLGKHVIPVPTFQIKREFSGYFVDPLRIFKGWSLQKSDFAEKSVVRPTYSYLGDYMISEGVISDIVNCVAKEMEGLAAVHRVTTEKTKEGIRILVPVFVFYDSKVAEVALTFQKTIREQVELMTAFHVEGVDIEVRELR